MLLEYSRIFENKSVTWGSVSFPSKSSSSSEKKRWAFSMSASSSSVKSSSVAVAAVGLWRSRSPAAAACRQSFRMLRSSGMDVTSPPCAWSMAWRYPNWAADPVGRISGTMSHSSRLGIPPWFARAWNFSTCEVTLIPSLELLSRCRKIWAGLQSFSRAS